MKEKSLKKNFIYNFLYQLLAILVPLVTSPYLARVLGAENIGISSWTSTIAFYFGIFVTLGIENYGSREIAYIRQNSDSVVKKFWSIYACQVINLCVIILIYSIYILVGIREYRTIFYILIFAILTKGLDITWFFNGLEEFKVTVLRNTIVKIITLICIFVFVRNDGDLWKYVLINTLGTFTGQLMLWINIKKYVPRIYIPHKNEVFKNYKPLWILFIPVMAISIFTYMDKYMIGILSNVIENGYYENADKIISVPKAFITTIGTVMLPRASNLIANNKKEEANNYIEISMLYTIIMGSALTFGMAGVADLFSVVFWGADFAKSGIMIVGLAPAIIFSVVGSVVRSQYLIPYAKDKEYTLSLIISAFVNFVVNLILIPKFGGMGAVIGTLCSEYILMVIQLWCVKKELPIYRYLKNGFAFILFGIIMYIVLRLIKPYMKISVSSLIILIAIGGTIYILLCICYILFSKNSVAVYLKKALNKKHV